MLVSPQNLYFEILTPKDDSIRRWVFGRCFSHKGGILMNGVSALQSRLQRHPFAPYAI